ncbi:MAG: tyrosine-type recombinase/integrase, partial [Bacteroidales bacterium]|nr:tyrosine-type recombinase/integrase [Bacteroidales bacterium]
PILNPSLPWARYVTQSEKDTMTPDMKRHFITTISSKNAMINKNLTRMARMAGIPKKLSFHMARHSFAKYAKEKGLDNLEVKALLAHSNLSTTQNYMGEFETEKTDAALISVFSDDRLEAELLSRLQQLSPHRLRSLLGKLQC